jgi:hypothetical protein
MRSSFLNPEILEILSRKSELKPTTIRQNISKLRRNYPQCTLNAVAQIYASSLGLTVMQKLKQEDKDTIPHNEVINPKVRIELKKKKGREKIIEIINFKTNDYFINGHINEINKAYTKGCYTSTYILARKIIENLTLNILVKKYPPSSKTNLDIYYDVAQRRTKDFGALLKNLLNKKGEFGFEKSSVIERFYQRAKKFKDDANDKTHSWYHLVESRTEIEELKIQGMIELINKIME